MSGRTAGRAERTQAGRQRRRRTAGRTRAGTRESRRRGGLGNERLQPPARAPSRLGAGALAALARVPSPPSAVAKAQARVGAGNSARLRRPPSSQPRRASQPRTGQAPAEVTARRLPSRPAPAPRARPPARGVLGLLRPLTLSSLGSPAAPSPPSRAPGVVLPPQHPRPLGGAGSPSAGWERSPVRARPRRRPGVLRLLPAPRWAPRWQLSGVGGGAAPRGPVWNLRGVPGMPRAGWSGASPCV